ncbi:hypothetical protein [Listeria seeligeri]|uniref:hypothetical protein n=1 Tax=Listeria seeligeri TaxID=1640 RepID=UPI0031CC4E42
MSDIQLNENYVLKSTNQFVNKQQIFRQKSSIPARQNQFKSLEEITTIMTKIDTQMNQIQQFGESVTQDIESNCKEFVNLDENVLTNLEVMG